MMMVIALRVRQIRVYCQKLITYKYHDVSYKNEVYEFRFTLIAIPNNVKIDVNVVTPGGKQQKTKP